MLDLNEKIKDILKKSKESDIQSSNNKSND